MKFLVYTFIWILANLALLIGVRGIYIPLSSGRFERDFPVTLFLFILSIKLVVLLGGITGLLSAGPLLLISLAFPTLVYAGRYKQLVADMQAFSKGFHQGFLHLFSAENRGFKALLAMGFGYIVFRSIVHVWVLPPYVWDVLSYHLPNVAEWVQRGRIETFNTPNLQAYFPAGFGLVQTWFVLFPHHDAFVEGAGLLFFALAVSSVYLGARATGLPPRGGMAVALAFAATPAFLVQSTSCNNDIAVAGLYIFFTALWLDASAEGELKPRLIMVMAAVLFVGIGIKPTMVFMASGLLLLLLVSCFKKQVSFSLFKSAAWLHGAWLPVCAGWVGAFWYIRNWAVFGNPLYPSGFSLTGTKVFSGAPGGTPQGSIKVDSMITNLAALVQERIFDPGIYNPELHSMAGWGWIVVSVGLSALLVGIRRFESIRWLALGMTGSLLMVLVSVEPDPWNLRFIMWYAALPIWALGIALHHCRAGSMRRAFLGICAAGFILNALGCLGSGRFNFERWKILAWVPLQERSAAVVTSFSGRHHDAVLKQVPAGGTVLFAGGPFCNVYPLYGADFSRKVYYLQESDLDRLPDVIKNSGAHMVYIAEAVPPHYAGRLVKNLEQLGSVPRGGNLYEISN